MSLLNTITSARRDQTGAQSELGTTAHAPVTPFFKVKEGADGFGVTVFLPGVTKTTLEITAEANELRIKGRRAWKQPESWTQTHRESSDAPFELVLHHESSVDVDKAQAEFRDGVLRLALPKMEALKPRKIKIS